MKGKIRLNHLNFDLINKLLAIFISNITSCQYFIIPRLEQSFRGSETVFYRKYWGPKGTFTGEHKGLWYTPKKRPPLYSAKPKLTLVQGFNTGYKEGKKTLQNLFGIPLQRTPDFQRQFRGHKSISICLASWLTPLGTVNSCLTLVHLHKVTGK